MINTDIISEICKHLTIDDIIQCMYVCKQFNELFNGYSIWNNICGKINDDIMKYVRCKNEYGLQLYKNYMSVVEDIKILGKKFHLGGLPNNIFKFKYLHHTFREYLIFPKEICNLINLEVINMSYNFIKKIPRGINQLTNLNTFWLYHNEITNIPLKLCQLTKLTSLDLSYNLITKIPDQICQLVNLKLLNLYNNRITNIPNKIYKLTNLEQLYLDYNQIVRVPLGVCNLTKIKQVDLSNNNITKVSRPIKKLVDNKKIDLSNNPIDWNKQTKSQEPLQSYHDQIIHRGDG